MDIKNYSTRTWVARGTWHTDAHGWLVCVWLWIMLYIL